MDTRGQRKSLSLVRQDLEAKRHVERLFKANLCFYSTKNYHLRKV